MRFWQVIEFLPSLRPLPLLAIGFWFVHWRDGAPQQARLEPDPARAVTLALSARGLAAEPRDVHFLPPERPLFASPVDRRRAVVRARRRGDPSDIFLVETRFSPSGSLLEIDSVYNLSASSVADEQDLVLSGERAAWAIAGGDAISSVQYADFRGEPAPTSAGWTRLNRLQHALTNLQETGQLGGIRRRAFRLEPAAYKVVLGFSPNALLIDADFHKIRIADRGGALEGERYFKEITPPKARPGNLVTWAVDRVRAMPWFGDDRMQWLKAVAFDGRDQLEQIVSSVTGDDGSDTVKEELGDLFATGSVVSTDAAAGFPPPPMEPMLQPPLKGEGQWGSLDKDPFVARNPGAPTPFVFSFIRTDRKRIYSQIFVVLWDPRQIELHAMSGTVEPISATGETGPGQVPRDASVMQRFVGGFNGGFQAIHGEFGMMSERVVYLPPKPYAATVAELDDGSTAFGTWPEALDVPSNLVSFRQNMTALVENGEFNPRKRHWWGGLPPGWTEESRTVRSGLCMTKEGFVAYFYGASIDPDVLGLAMLRARCTYGIHLDMNPGHTGFEFYRTGRAGSLPELKRPLEDVWEARGRVPGLTGWEFMSRRMIKYMALMNFPRYIGVESRDFFYLTLRELLPGPALSARVTPAEPGEGVWRVDGLPQHGWPHAIATTNLRSDPHLPEFRVGLVKVDGKLVRVAMPSDAEPKVVLELREQSGAPPDAVALFHVPGRGFEIGPKPSSESAIYVASGFAPGAPAAANAPAALGVDRAGSLVYARVAAAPQTGGDGERLQRLLAELGCEHVALLPRPLATSLGAGSDAKGLGVKLIRAEGPGARRLFPDTPMVGPKVWAPLQQKRVRYRR
jgi:hypothetical protein